MKLNTNLSAHEKKLLYLLGALLAIAISYFLIFQSNIKAAKALEEQNAIDKQTVATLEEMVSRQSEVETDTAMLREEKAAIVAKYPTDVTPEKAIMNVQDIETANETHVSSLSFLMDNLVGDISATTSYDEEGNEIVSTNGNSNVGFYASLSMNYEATYDNFKKMVDYITGLKDRTVIPAVTMSYDTESGNLSGVITLNMYYLTGTENEYVAPAPGVNAGVSDIFNSGGGGSVGARSEEGFEVVNSSENAAKAEGN